MTNLLKLGDVVTLTSQFILGEYGGDGIFVALEPDGSRLIRGSEVFYTH